MKNNVIMRRQVRLSAVIAGLLACIAIFGTGLSHAQDLEIHNPGLVWVDPDPTTYSDDMYNYNYGNVVAGESLTTTFDLYSAGPTAVWVYTATLNETSDFVSGSQVTPIALAPSYTAGYTLGAFSFDRTDDVWNGTQPIVREMPTGEHLYMDIIFTPPTLGDFSAYLLIHCNDSVDEPGMYAVIHLQGTGVDANPVPEPATLLLLGMGMAFTGLAVIRRRMK